MRRGDLVTVALQGEQGKPRPALVVQTDHFAGLPAVTVLPLTGTLVEGLVQRERVLVKPAQGRRVTHDEAERALEGVRGRDL